MTRNPTTALQRDIGNAGWLHRASLAHVFEALQNGGGETRVIGGAVRNALLGEHVTDIDLATTLVPDDVIRHATAAGLSVYPTGIDHGTVTVVAHGDSFEVTTLRRDVETDGRHAVVGFTHDWHEDALRRDFTINALSADLHGTVFDTVGGLTDLAARHVRFIGDAGTRIREDYLRILRFFRFSSAYAIGTLDADGLTACTALKDGLKKLSAERIGAEMLKFIVTPRAGDVATIMEEHDILAHLVALTSHPERLTRLQAIEAELGDHPDASTRMAALFINRANDAENLAKKFRLSRAHQEALANAAAINRSDEQLASDNAIRGQIYRLGQDAFARALRVAWARSEAPTSDPAWIAKIRLAASWSPPAMPVSGADVLALGIPAGPRVGVILSAFEDWWISADFPTESALHREKLSALASAL